MPALATACSGRAASQPGFCRTPARPAAASQRHVRRSLAAAAGGGGRRQKSGGGGARGGRGGGSEDVEIFNIESGWSVEALESLPELLAAGGGEGWAVEAAPRRRARGSASSSASSDDSSGGDSGVPEADDGWSVEAVSGSGPAGAQTRDEEDEDEADGTWDDEEDEGWVDEDEEPAAAGGTGRKAAAGATDAPRFNGRVMGKAEQQLLGSVPRHLLRQLEEQQREADEEKARLRPSVVKKAAARLKTHQQLRIISGTAAGRRLKSPQGDQTRPMMEMVRNAVFSMVMSLYGCASGLPPTARWLDLFAGTGAVGIEALSRGVGEAHFVEMSPWVVSNCLMPNLEACGVESDAVVHTGKAEDFLRRAAAVNRFAGGAFDFLSVCPPYELVDYNELYDLLDASPLVHEESIVIVEYPKKLASLVRPTLGPLHKLRDRRYGRTYLAIYGPAEADELSAA